MAAAVTFTVETREPEPDISPMYASTVSAVAGSGAMPRSSDRSTNLRHCKSYAASALPESSLGLFIESSVRTPDHMNITRVAHAGEDLRLSMSSSQVGDVVQTLASHVLLRLHYQVIKDNPTGHPDIIAFRPDVGEVRFEVEAEVLGTHPRQLTKEDFDSLVGIPDAAGYFGLAVLNPTPHWILVPAERLVNRNQYSNALLNALRDKQFSDDWTHQYVRLLNDECRRILSSPSSELRRRALDGHGL